MFLLKDFFHAKKIKSRTFTFLPVFCYLSFEKNHFMEKMEVLRSSFFVKQILKNTRLKLKNATAIVGRLLVSCLKIYKEKSLL